MTEIFKVYDGVDLDVLKKGAEELDCKLPLLDIGLDVAEEAFWSGMRITDSDLSPKEMVYASYLLEVVGKKDEISPYLQVYFSDRGIIKCVPETASTLLYRETKRAEMQLRNGINAARAEIERRKSTKKCF